MSKEVVTWARLRAPIARDINLTEAETAPFYNGFWSGGWVGSVCYNYVNYFNPVFVAAGSGCGLRTEINGFKKDWSSGVKIPPWIVIVMQRFGEYGGFGMDQAAGSFDYPHPITAEDEAQLVGETVTYNDGSFTMDETAFVWPGQYTGVIPSEGQTIESIGNLELV
jgi:hypothetical protein